MSFKLTDAKGRPYSEQNRFFQHFEEVCRLRIHFHLISLFTSKRIKNSISFVFNWLKSHLFWGCYNVVFEKRSIFNTGLPRSGKGQGILYQVREILNSTSKTVKSQGIVFFASNWSGLGKGFLVSKGNVVSKNVYKGIDFCGFIAGFICREFVFYGPWKMVSGQWKVFEFYFRDKWQPCNSWRWGRCCISWSRPTPPHPTQPNQQGCIFTGISPS